jgi:hypothetical protein
MTQPLDFERPDFWQEYVNEFYDSLPEPPDYEPENVKEGEPLDYEPEYTLEDLLDE